MYFFEHILERLSRSKYKSNIILKGGLLLSSIIGESERTTKDMDAVLKSMPLERENIEKIVREILNIDINDGICYTIIDIKDIRKESEYGGFKINLLAEMSTVKVYLAIEFTTGDTITPREIEYQYHCIFEPKIIPIFAYTVETVIAEKYQTIIERDSYNTRMKDFYDLFVLVRYNKEKIDFENLILAIKNTFRNRGTELNIEKMQEQLEDMQTNETLIKAWKNYQKTAPYAKYIVFEELFETLKDINDIVRQAEIKI